MYLHIGRDVTVPLADIIGIFDLETTLTSETTNSFFSRHEENKRVISTNEGIPKSFVVCFENRVSVVYISQLSASTLKKRAQNSLLYEEEDPAQEEIKIESRKESII